MEVPLGMPKKNKTGRNCSKQFFAAPAVICYRPDVALLEPNGPIGPPLGPRGPNVTPAPGRVFFSISEPAFGVHPTNTRPRKRGRKVEPFLGGTKCNRQSRFTSPPPI